jgi:alpha-galactosidase
LPDAAEYFVAMFRLPGGDPTRTFRLYQLDAEHTYEVRWLLTDRTEHRRGADLITHGLACDDLPEEGSALLLLR